MVHGGLEWIGPWASIGGRCAGQYNSLASVQLEAYLASVLLSRGACYHSQLPICI